MLFFQNIPFTSYYEKLTEEILIQKQEVSAHLLLEFQKEDELRVLELQTEKPF